MIMGVGLTEIVNYILIQSAAGNPDGMSIFKNPTVELSYVFISTAILIISGVIAGYMPARRAVRIKPIEAMRGRIKTFYYLFYLPFVDLKLKYENRKYNKTTLT